MVRIFGRTYDRAPGPALSVQQLKRQLDQGEDVVVVDVRQPTGYDAYPGTIPGSVRNSPNRAPGALPGTAARPGACPLLHLTA